MAKLTEDQIIARALDILEARATYSIKVTGPKDICEYLKVKLALYDYECFGCIWLDNSHNVLGFEELFQGTINETRIYPREMIKKAFQIPMVSAVILFHNHPSGNLTPSNADLALTKKLQNTFDAVDMKVLDHIVFAGGKMSSFAEKGYI